MKSIDEAKSILKSQPLSIDSGELEDVINFDGTPANVSTATANNKSTGKLVNSQQSLIHLCRFLALTIIKYLIKSIIK